MKKMILSVACVLFIFLGSSPSIQVSASDVSLEEVAEFIASKESGAVAGESYLSPIRSKSDLEAYINSRKTGPLGYLDVRSLKLFLDSLVFTKNGLASYRYIEIEKELTPRQATELLGLFGVQRTIYQLEFVKASADERAAMEKMNPVIYEDHKGYKCEPPATCAESMGRICIGANCGMIP